LTMPKGSNETTYAWVCDSLRESILNAEFQPGERLIMSKLTKKFGISQMPIREALQKLQGEGLISISPFKGAQVRKVDQKFVRNLYDFRMAVECMLARKAYPRIPRIGIDRLIEAQAAYDHAVTKSDNAGLVAANLKFHSVIFSYSDNEEALMILNSHSSLLRTLRTIYGFDPGRSKRVCKEHHAIIKALQGPSETRLLEAYERHCENAKRDLLNEMAKRERGQAANPGQPTR
jgi:DNA-binding GntR family transcriptional regulator